MEIPEINVTGDEDVIESRTPRLNPKELMDLKQTRIYLVEKYEGKVTGVSKDNKPYTRYSWIISDEFVKRVLTNFDFFYKAEGTHKNKDLVGKRIKLSPYSDTKVILEIL